MRVAVSGHALTRWRERVGPAKDGYIRRQVIGNLREQLRVGLEVGGNAVFLPIASCPGIVAVLTIDPSGTWVVKTFRKLAGQ